MKGRTANDGLRLLDDAEEIARLLRAANPDAPHGLISRTTRRIGCNSVMGLAKWRWLETVGDVNAATDSDLLRIQKVGAQSVALWRRAFGDGPASPEPPSYRTWTMTDIEAVIARRRAGASLRIIAKDLGVNEATLAQALSRFGFRADGSDRRLSHYRATVDSRNVAVNER